MSNHLPPRPPARRNERKVPLVEDMKMLQGGKATMQTAESYMSSFDTSPSRTDDQEGLLTVLEDFIFNEIHDYVSSDDSDSDDSESSSSSVSTYQEDHDDDDEYSDDDDVQKDYAQDYRIHSTQYSVKKGTTKEHVESKKKHAPVEQRLARYLDASTLSRSFSMTEGLTTQQTARSMIAQVKRLSSEVQVQSPPSDGESLSPEKLLEIVKSEEEITRIPAVWEPLTKHSAAPRSHHHHHHHQQQQQQMSTIQPFLRSPSSLSAEHARRQSRRLSHNDNETTPPRQIPSSSREARKQSFNTMDATCRDGLMSPLDAPYTPGTQQQPFSGRVPVKPTSDGPMDFRTPMASFPRTSLNDNIKRGSNSQNNNIEVSAGDSPGTSDGEEVIEFDTSESPDRVGGDDGKEALWNNQRTWERWAPVEETTAPKGIVQTTLCALEATQKELFGKPDERECRDDKETTTEAEAKKESVGKYKFQFFKNRSPDVREDAEQEPSHHVVTSPLRSPESLTYEIDDSSSSSSSAIDVPPPAGHQVKVVGLVQQKMSNADTSPTPNRVRTDESKAYFQDTIRKVKGKTAKDSEDIEILRESSAVVVNNVSGQESKYGYAQLRKDIDKKQNNQEALTVISEGTEEKEQSSKSTASSGPPPPPPPPPPPRRATDKNLSKNSQKTNRGRSCSLGDENDGGKGGSMSSARVPAHKRVKKTRSNPAAVSQLAWNSDSRKMADPNTTQCKKRRPMPLNKEGSAPLKISELSSSGNVEVQSGCTRNAGPTICKMRQPDSPMSLYDSEGHKVKKARKRLFRRPGFPTLKGSESSSTTNSNPRFRLRFPGIQGRRSQSSKSELWSITEKAQQAKDLIEPTSDPVDVSSLGKEPQQDAVATAASSFGIDSQNSLLVSEQENQSVVVGQACMDLHPLVLEGKGDTGSMKNKAVVLYPLLDFNPCHGDLMHTPGVEHEKFDFERLEKTVAREQLESHDKDAATIVCPEEVPKGFPSKISEKKPAAPIPKEDTPPSKQVEIGRAQPSTKLSQRVSHKKPGIGNIFRRAFGKNNRNKPSHFPVHFPHQHGVGATEQSVECAFGAQPAKTPPQRGKTKKYGEETIARKNGQSARARANTETSATSSATGRTASSTTTHETCSTSCTHKTRKGLTKSEKRVARRLVNDLKLLSRIEESRNLLKSQAAPGKDFAKRVQSIEASLQTMILVDGMVRQRLRNNVDAVDELKNKKNEKSKPKRVSSGSSGKENADFFPLPQAIFNAIFCSCVE